MRRRLRKCTAQHSTAQRAQTRTSTTTKHNNNPSQLLQRHIEPGCSTQLKAYPSTPTHQHKLPLRPCSSTPLITCNYMHRQLHISVAHRHPTESTALVVCSHPDGVRVRKKRSHVTIRNTQQHSIQRRHAAPQALRLPQTLLRYAGRYLRSTCVSKCPGCDNTAGPPASGVLIGHMPPNHITP